METRTSEKSSRTLGEKVDTKLLGEEIILPFSGKKAKNRFMKAPMTERLCEWPENHQENMVYIPNFLCQFSWLFLMETKELGRRCRITK
jgi:hypothetical protein